jgi:hypothetical protein
VVAGRAHAARLRSELHGLHDACHLHDRREQEEADPMATQKLVRCEIRRPGGAPASVRFVPLEIFGLWEYLMRTKHEFDIVSNVASLWIDVEENPDAAYGENAYDRVTEVTLLRYSERDGMFGKVNRYFPTEEYPQLKNLLLKHYESVREPGAPNLQIQERQGIWIRRQPRAA